MIGFSLLMGHLIGDYVLQNDWQAKNKINPHPGKKPEFDVKIQTMSEYKMRRAVWTENSALYQKGHIACTIHCALYTMAVWGCTFWWLPLWALPVIFFAHWPVDRFKLAAYWMKNISGQSFFASEKHPMFPWSVVCVDNIFHLIVLFAIGLIAGNY